MKLPFSLTFFIWCSFSYGASGADTDEVSMSVMEGDSVTLNTGVETKQQEKIIWYFNDARIAIISGDLSRICTDVQCNVQGTERFRDRLKLDHQTGSLTITNITNTDAGVYQLIISSSRRKIFTVAVHGVFGVGPDGMSAFVMEGDSVTLHTGVRAKREEKINWYYNNIRIAIITGDLSKICTDVQCNEGTERFRNRLKLDHQTGSLTITNTTNTDSGEYQLKIISSSEKIFNITIRDVPAAEQDKMKRKSVKEGESVTFYTRVIKQPNDVMMWYFNDTLITEITGDQSKICTDVQCDERFRGRLKLDHQTGSLTITNTTNTDTGEYKLLINSGSISIIKTFSSFIYSVTDSALSSAAAVIAVVAVVVLLVALAAAGVIYHHRQKGNANLDNRVDNQNVEEGLLPQQNGIPMVHNRTGSPSADTPLLPAANGTVLPPGDTQLPAPNGTGPPPADTHIDANGTTQ